MMDGIRSFGDAAVNMISGISGRFKAVNDPPSDSNPAAADSEPAITVESPKKRKFSSTSPSKKNYSTPAAKKARRIRALDEADLNSSVSNASKKTPSSTRQSIDEDINATPAIQTTVTAETTDEVTTQGKASEDTNQSWETNENGKLVLSPSKKQFIPSTNTSQPDPARDDSVMGAMEAPKANTTKARKSVAVTSDQSQKRSNKTNNKHPELPSKLSTGPDVKIKRRKARQAEAEANVTAPAQTKKPSAAPKKQQQEKAVPAPSKVTKAIVQKLAQKDKEIPASFGKKAKNGLESSPAKPVPKNRKSTITAAEAVGGTKASNTNAETSTPVKKPRKQKKAKAKKSRGRVETVAQFHARHKLEMNFDSAYFDLIMDEYLDLIQQQYEVVCGMRDAFKAKLAKGLEPSPAALLIAGAELVEMMYKVEVESDEDHPEEDEESSDDEIVDDASDADESEDGDNTEIEDAGEHLDDAVDGEFRFRGKTIGAPKPRGRKPAAKLLIT